MIFYSTRIGEGELSCGVREGKARGIGGGGRLNESLGLKLLIFCGLWALVSNRLRL